MTYENIKNRLLEATDCGNIECITEFRALSAVVELHKPKHFENPKLNLSWDECTHCLQYIGEYTEPAPADYPCPTIQAIEKELLS